MAPEADLLPVVPPANSPLLGSQVEFRLPSSSGKNLKDLNLRRAADGRELHAVVACPCCRAGVLHREVWTPIFRNLSNSEQSPIRPPL
jgi:hypothetical protein